MTTHTLPKVADPVHLTEVLRRSGALGPEHVRDITPISSLKKARSNTLRLRLNYEGPAENAPRSVILKMGHRDSSGGSSYANCHEIAFYRHIAPALPEQPVPRCFEAVEATGVSAWHLLLEDLTDSHFIATEWPLPPTFEHCEHIVHAQAHFHALWWNDPRLGVSVGRWRDTDDWDQSLRILANQFARFTDRFGELMPPDRRDLYQHLFDQGPRLLARYYTHLNLTLVHGDAHFWNFFLPRHGGSEGVRLIDWEDWHINIATSDLACMMAMLWYPDRRRRLERPLLDRYHAALLAGGVSGYDRQALDDDYRLSVLWMITRPILQAVGNLHPRVWWNNLERVMLAVDDLGCRDLLA